MKKALVAAMVLGMLAFLAAPAMADITLSGGAFTLHVRDGSSLYAPQAQGGPYVPRVANDHAGDPAYSAYASTVPALGDENRAVFSVDQIIYASGAPTLNVPEGTLTGMFYDFAAKTPSVVVIAGQPHVEIGYGALGRNPLVSLESDTPAGSGGVIEVWLHPPVINQPAGYGAQYDVLDPQAAAGSPNGTQTAPFLWNEVGGPAGNNHAVAPDGFPNANETTAGAADPGAILWLQAVVVPGSNGDLLDEDINTVTGSGNYAAAFLDIIGGVAAPEFQKDVFGVGKDLEIQLTIQGPSTDGSHNTYDSLNSPGDLQTGADRGGWQVNSSNPVRGAGVLVPEPMTMTLLGLGLAGLAAYRRRK